MTLPLPALPTVPAKRRCRRCGHPVPTGRLYDGMGEACAVMVGLLVRRPRWPVVHGEAADQQDLLDLIKTKEIHMTVKTFRKMPVEIQAMRWADPEDAYALVEWAAGDVSYDEHTSGPEHPNTGEDWGRLAVTTLEGEHVATPGDWLIKGVRGEFYFCKHDVFQQTYEQVG